MKARGKESYPERRSDENTGVTVEARRDLVGQRGDLQRAVLTPCQLLQRAEATVRALRAARPRPVPRVRVQQGV